MEASIDFWALKFCMRITGKSCGYAKSKLVEYLDCVGED